ncbi:TenA family protein [Loktanella sp. SALINAS62]|uniref:TenA family protein n=1 Tax=Loktanella sp. SALINAS62 TaxID=2706124 RepID=UPI002010EFE9|nr:TenA family protein [Loktanella sp. SALINAS62]
MMLLSNKILSANTAILDQMLKHRFVADIQADTLPQDVFHRYLAYEGRFVETAISIFAFATIGAPDIGAQRRLIGVQDALANTQVPYFEDIFAKRGIALDTPVPDAVIAFDAGMLDIARTGQFTDVLTAMFAAEWMYWTWSQATKTELITDPDLRAWVELHAAPDFADQAMWLKDAIDTYGDDSDAERLSQVFGDIMQLEIAFHSAAYDNPPKRKGS